MVLYKHKRCVDTAIRITHYFSEDKKAVVDYYNIYYFLRKEGAPEFICECFINLDNLDDYEKIVIEK